MATLVQTFLEHVFVGLEELLRCVFLEMIYNELSLTKEDEV